MTYRHIHCVHCVRIENECRKCIKHNIIFYPLHGDPTQNQKGWFENHCNDFILKECVTGGKKERKEL